MLNNNLKVIFLFILEINSEKPTKIEETITKKVP